jgi:hypothetical protein
VDSRIEDGQHYDRQDEQGDDAETIDDPRQRQSCALSCNPGVLDLTARDEAEDDAEHAG